ncbi:Protein of unknown function [Bradyrhizobium sp. Rc2d]|uniref:DUF2798 domain-containing protein n=1 Tax=Bradyrhizobium sp. Rc2d TaxID=1855321 RepID=UPI0008853DED|nr:DUF2798 domain-containing protein [Bradyrhizobium sp. Rc2d]SDJ63398.1 Protein of unknown function [Bradyrhizobium sp. Rc2d]
MTTHFLPKISRKHGHFVFGVIQSGLTAAIASGVANFHLVKEGVFILSWLGTWLTSWTLMVPIVLIAAPVIRRIVSSISYE